MDADVTENAGAPPEPDNAAADGRQSEAPGAADRAAVGSTDQKSADSGDHVGVDPDDGRRKNRARKPARNWSRNPTRDRL